MLNEAQVFKNKKKAKYSNRYHRRVNNTKNLFPFLWRRLFQRTGRFEKWQRSHQQWKAQQQIATAKPFGLKLTSSSYREACGWQSVQHCWVSAQAWGQVIAGSKHHLTRQPPSNMFCTALRRWFCLCFYRKHFQARILDVFISERQSIDVIKIMLCNSRNLYKAISSLCHLVQSLKASSARWVVGVILVSPSH